jgi:hypothetical protein
MTPELYVIGSVVVFAAIVVASLPKDLGSGRAIIQ